MICTFRSKGGRDGFYPPDKESISNFDMDDLLELILDRILDLYFLYCEEDEGQDEYIEDGKTYDPSRARAVRKL